MIIAILLGIAVGYVLAIPPGPIGMAAIRSGIRSGWIPSAKLALGAGIMDVIYMAVAMFAMTAIQSKLASMELKAPWVSTGLQILVVLAMAIYGVIMLRERPKPIEPEALDIDGKNKRLSNWAQGHGPFFVGVGFAIANLANPSFFGSIVATTATIHELDLFASDMIDDLSFAVGFGTGNVLWLLTLARLVIHFRNRMTPTFIRRIHQVSGLTLIGISAVYCFRIIRLAF